MRPNFLWSVPSGRSVSRPVGGSAELQHGYALRGAVEMSRRAASPGRLQTLVGGTQHRGPGPGAHDDP